MKNSENERRCKSAQRALRGITEARVDTQIGVLESGVLLGGWRVAVKRVHRDLERAIFLPAPYNDGLALVDHGLCTWRLDRHCGAPDFDGKVTSLDDIDDIEIKSLHPAFDHALLGRPDGRSALDHGHPAVDGLASAARRY